MEHQPSGALLGIILLLLLCAFGAQAGRPLRVMTWNVENLFDTVHDEGCRDEEFLPNGTHHWTSYRYWQKLTDVSRVVAAVADDGGLPDLIGLCEVENDSVLTTLTRRSILRQLNYHYVMTSCEDARGIDVALLYQPARFRLLEWRSVRVPSREHGLRATRDILYTKGLVMNAEEAVDTLHALVVHLPSRTGGRQGDRNRRLAAQTLWNTVDSIASAASHNPHILVMGDFNAPSHDRVFKHVPLRLTDDPEALGTYCYQGLWEWIDHILVSSSLSPTALARPVNYPWLLEKSQGYNVPMPRRTFRGFTYNGGISDHLPLVIDFQVE